MKSLHGLTRTLINNMVVGAVSYTHLDVYKRQVVTQIKTVDNDGYSAVQVGYVDKKERTVNKDKGGKKEVIHRHGVKKAQKGHFDKAGVSCKRYVREFKFDNASEYAPAQEIKADIFAAGDKVDATAISKGKGFQGAIKRHGQHRGPMAHGSKFHRHQGSNGACSSPSRVFKGKGMPGHMGLSLIHIWNILAVCSSLRGDCAWNTGG